MRLLRWASVGLVVAMLPVLGLGLRAQGPVTTFQGIGDLPGGYTFSGVRDAIRVGSVVYAVGGSATKNQSVCTAPNTPPGCFPSPNTLGADTPVLWTRDGVNAPVLTALPNLLANPNSNQTGMFASAITPDAGYIAGIAHDQVSGPSRVATRVTTSGLVTQNLNVSPYTVFTSPTSANAISSDGSVLYGNVTVTTSIGPPVVNVGRVARFDVGIGSALIPLPLLAGVVNSSVINRGTSADGSIVVGFAGGLPAGPRAFRYDHATGVSSLIPLLSGGTRSAPRALSPDGNLVLVTSTSTQAPNGEAYLYNATTSGITVLGSPNATWSTGSGGLTADGSVVAMSFFLTGTDGTANQAFFHNSNGWFFLMSALARAGVDVVADGWGGLQIAGMSSDGTLVYGQGTHETIPGDPASRVQEGFVAAFPINYLRDFSAPAVPPANTSIVGAWNVPSEPISPIIVFNADGTFVLIEADSVLTPAGGFERGTYTWDHSTGAITFTTRMSTKGDYGMSEGNGMLNLFLEVSGDTATLTGFKDETGIPETFAFARVTGAPESLVGGWVGGNPAVADSSAVLVVLSDGTYYFAQDGEMDLGGHDGIEKGALSWNPLTGVVTTTTAIDTNGEWGLSHPVGVINVTLSADGLVATGHDDSADPPSSFIRIVDPNAATFRPEITSPLSTTGAIGAPFSFTVTADHGATVFGALGLPTELTVNPGTGVISGTPVEATSFDVEVSASNTLSTGTATLHVVIVNTAPGNDIVVEPEVPPGAAPVTLTFSNVVAPGETTVTVIDATTAPAPPTGFSLGSSAVYYDVATTATLGGPATICFNYAGVDFGGVEPRLFHYVAGAWVDITTSVDPGTTTICGLTSSFSPFAILASTITRTGFYAPVNSTPGSVNRIEGGSTVPLKFNIYVSGVEKTDTSGLQFSVTAVACSGARAGRRDDEDRDERDRDGNRRDEKGSDPRGGTSLRYDARAHQFILNWKTPRTEGMCYVARITTTADGGSLSALFRTK